MIRIPKRFYDDHVERDLPTPEILKETKAHYFISPTDENLDELLNDAEHYSDCAGIGWDVCGALGLQSSARATVKALGETK